MSGPGLTGRQDSEQWLAALSWRRRRRDTGPGSSVCLVGPLSIFFKSELRKAEKSVFCFFFLSVRGTGADFFF